MTLREVLEQQGLMDDNIKAELDNVSMRGCKTPW